MRGLVTSIATLGLCVGLLASTAAAQSALERIKARGELTIGTSGVYAPFEYVEDGKLVGFDIDLGQMMAQKLGVKPTFVKIEWKGIIAALKSGRADILITAMTK